MWWVLWGFIYLFNWFTILNNFFPPYLCCICIGNIKKSAFINYGRFRECGIFFLREKYLMVLFRGRFRRGRDILTSKLSRAQRSAIETPLNSDQNCCSENKKSKDFYLQPSREEVLTVFSRQVKSICKKKLPFNT